MASVENVKKTFDYVFKEVGKVVIGQEEMLRQMMIAIFCDSNALVESVPGLAKTLSVRTIADILDLKFARIQNTPDLMPSDITGTYIVEEAGGKRTFKFQPGPIFANIVLADEINRATPKTQAALLEAMQEKQVTVGNKTFELDRPFFVLATQNPIEQEGSLALDQPVFINGSLQTGKELLEQSKGVLIEDERGIQLHDIDAWTLALNHEGKLEKQRCLLYTLPYNDEFMTITTKSGKHISVTKNHPFLVNDRGATVWKKAEDLTKEDYLVNPGRLYTEEASFQTHKDTVEKIKGTINEIPFNTDFAFWIACILSDGHIGKKCVAFTQKNYPQALDRWVSISKQYGFNPGISESNGCRDARIYSKPLVDYLHARFGIKSNKEKAIPQQFLSLSDNMNREFVRTFIALESSCRDNRIVFTQKCKEDVNIISYMLLREGILPWIRHDGRIFRLKIQGEDFLTYLNTLGWIDEAKRANIDASRKTKSSFRVVPVDRKAILSLVECFGLNSFHTLKDREAITNKPWYGSYKGIKEGEQVMSRASLRAFADDMRKELDHKRSPEFKQQLNTNTRAFAAGIGTPMTQVVQECNLSKHKVWQHYAGSTQCVQVQEFLQETHSQRLKQAEELVIYCEALLSDDIYYDKIKSIAFTPAQTKAFGLTVPNNQNYIAGFGGCGINHNTYPLPEAQSDRFLFKIKLDYPPFDDEVEILNRYTEDKALPKLKPVLKKSSILSLQRLVRQIPISNDLKKYCVDIVNKTRTKKDLIEYGASPRASMGLVLSSKARALMDGRKYVSKTDVNAMSLPILRHRIILNFEAERQGLEADAVIKKLLS